MKTQIVDGKILAQISELQEWADNPRVIDEVDFERLKKQITKFGVYKPLIVMADGVVIGGNMRLRALKDLGYTECWVSIVEPASEAEMIEIALSDNDRVGYYDGVRLNELLEKAPEIELADYSIDLSKAMHLDEYKNFSDMGNMYGRTEAKGEDKEPSEKNECYFYIEYYGDRDKFNEITEMLKDNLKTEHIIDPEIFFDMVRKYALPK